MSLGVGAVDVTFVGLAGSYLAEPGTTDGATVAKVNVTPAGVTDAEYCAGDVKEQTDPTATLLADFTVDVNGLVGTSGLLTFTYPISNTGNTTNGTLSGTAFLQSASETSGQNARNVYDLVWVWEGVPTFSPEAA